MNRRSFVALSATAACLGGTPALHAAPVAYYTDSGVGIMSTADAQAWGGTNNTQNSVAFETIIDFTPAVDDQANPIVLWEAGGSGDGAALVLDGDDLHFFAGGSETHAVSGAHGLTATQNGVQILAVFQSNGGSGTNELLSLYVNGGSPIGTADLETGNDWAGSDNAGLGSAHNTQRYLSTALFVPGDVVNYPETDISFAAYLLASSGGNPDNTIEKILVPEPGSLALLGIGGLLLGRRRRR